MNMQHSQLNMIVSFSIKLLLPLGQIKPSSCSTWPNVESIVLRVNVSECFYIVNMHNTYWEILTYY